MNIKNSLVRNRRTPSRPSPNGEGEHRVFMNMPISSKVNVSLCDALGACLQSAEEQDGERLSAFEAREAERQVEGLFESLLSESFGG